MFRVRIVIFGVADMYLSFEALKIKFSNIYAFANSTTVD